jgi:hypothetical protein
MMNSRRFYIIPQEENNRIALLNVDRNTKEDIRLSYKIVVSNDWECNTIANYFVENMLMYIGHTAKNGMQSEIDFYDLFKIQTTMRTNEKAEKEGSINIAFTINSGVDDIITDMVPRERREYQTEYVYDKFASFENKDKLRFFKQILRITQRELENKCSIVIPNSFNHQETPEELQAPWTIIAITHTFVSNIIKELMYMVANNEASNMAYINFNDNIKFYATLSSKDDNVKVSLMPGPNAKLIVKSDITTEGEESENV